MTLCDGDVTSEMFQTQYIYMVHVKETCKGEAKKGNTCLRTSFYNIITVLT
jgi:hypothetical protein